MTDRDPTEPNEPSPSEPNEQPMAGTPPPNEAAAGPDAPDGAERPVPDDFVPSEPESDRSRRRILIGSQRDPGAYSRRRFHRDWEPVEGEGAEKPDQPPEPEATEPPQLEPQAPEVQACAASPPPVAEAPARSDGKARWDDHPAGGPSRPAPATLERSALKAGGSRPTTRVRSPTGTRGRNASPTQS